MSFLSLLWTGRVRRMLLPLAAGAVTALAVGGVQAATLHVYGPGGPAPAMKEAAAAFAAQRNTEVEVTAGPTPQWVEQARADADVIYSGSEAMMSDFAGALKGVFDTRDAEPLYLRPVSILVRPGNPKNITGFEDLLQPGMRVLAVAGAGQTALWEDVAGRKGNIETVRALRRNLVLPEAANSAVARQQWTDDTSIDAWLIWNIWQVSNASLADSVPVEEPWRIYRDTGVVLTTRGKESAEARDFVRFLQSDEGKRIFAKWGWETGADK